MKSRQIPWLLCIALFAPLSVHCADSSTEEHTEVSVSQRVYVSFGAMKPSESETVTLTLDDLRFIPDFDAHRDRLRCAALDRQRTRLTSTKYTAGGAATGMIMSVAFRGQADPSWTPWINFEGSIEQGESLDASEGTLAVDEDLLLKSLLLSEKAILEIRMEAQADQEVDEVEFDLELILFFSSQPAECVERRS